MIFVERFKAEIQKPARFSYLFILVMLLLAGWLHLGPPLVAGLFAYLILDKFQFVPWFSKWVSIALFLIVVAAASYGLGHFTNQTVRALPEIAENAIPKIIQFARQYQIELPFTDFESLKETGIDAVKNQASYLGSFAKFASGATQRVVLLILGCVIAMSLFLHPRFEFDARTAPPTDLYSACTAEIAARFATFYRSFGTVMGAQILISGINTIFTGIFVLVTGLRYGVVIIGVTFLCGLVPVVGNLISNTIIVAIGFTHSPRMALAALIFLIVIHKMEYFLNSKIIGGRIKNPVWLTLLGLVVGERLMGIPGMILAPVFLHYIKMEASAIPVTPVNEVHPRSEQSIQRPAA